MSISTLRLLFIVVIAVLSQPASAQQLKLGTNPFSVQKSAVLELNSDNQGLLLVRISDTAQINSLLPPDGMIIFFTPTKQLFVRSNNYWRALATTSNIGTLWSTNGNITGGLKHIGSTDNYDLSVITNNIERMRFTTGGYVGIGSSVTPTTTLHVKSGVSNDAGLRLENLTSASTATANASAIGVDAAGKVVKVKAPTYYSGGVGGTAAVEEAPKIWVAELTNSNNVAAGVSTYNFPSNIGFTHIHSIQVTAKSANGVNTAPVALVSSNTLTSVTIRLLESKGTVMVALGVSEGLEPHSETATKIFIRVEGN